MNSHPQRRGRSPGSGQNDVAQIGTVIELRRQKHNPFGRRDENTHIAIAQDVANLLGLEQRIDGNESASRGRCAEAGDDHFLALFQIDGDPLVALAAQLHEAGGESQDLLRQMSVRRDTLLRLQRRA